MIRRMICTFAMLLLFLLLCGLLLSNCGGTPVDGLPSPQGIESLQVGKDTYCLSEYPGLESGVMLCRIPQGERMPIPVCGKSGCRHRDGSCDGVSLRYLPEECASLSSNVGLFRDRLYFLSLLPEQKLAVISMNPETAERRVELTLEPLSLYHADTPGFNVSGLFHENNLILLYSKDSGEFGEAIHRMVVVNLATGKQKELLRSHFEEQLAGQYMMVLGDPMALGNRLYLFEYGKGSLPDSNPYRPEHRFSQVDLKTGKITQLFRDNFIQTWRIEGEKVFFSDQTENRFKEFDLAAGQWTVMPMEEITGESFYLDDRIVRNSVEFDFDTQESTVSVDFYSRDYAHLDALEYTGELVFLRSTPEALYFRSDKTFLYLDRSEIGSGDLQLKPLG